MIKATLSDISKKSSYLRLNIHQKKQSLLKELVLQKSPEDETEVLRLEPNDEVIITHTDNIQWCMVQTTDGQEGWFAIDGFDKIRGLNISASEVFSGLNYAD